MRIRNATKRFKIYHDPQSGLLKELIFPWRRDRYYREFLAVRDVSLDIRRGEVVGVIGPNGAGKSTLLKMVAGLLPVDQGTIDVNGKITAVMAMGVGSHPEFSGRENILYGGLLLGMSKREVLRKMPSIVDFSELDAYIDRPLKTYSSGMTARLLFSIAMSVDPDILIVDEALATGDQHFVEKCIHRIRQFARQGVTIFFVSHNLGLVQDLCHRAVLLKEGSVACVGSPRQVVEVYQGEGTPSPTPSLDELVLTQGTSQLQVTDVRLFDCHGNESRDLLHSRKLVVEVAYRRLDQSIEAAHLDIGFCASTINWMWPVHRPAAA